MMTRSAQEGWQTTLSLAARSAPSRGHKGLFSPTAFAEELDDEVARAERYDRPLGLALFCLDGFEAWADAEGPGARDAMLASVISACLRTLRRHDVLCHRGGGDFAVLLVETGAQGAIIAANRLRKAIASEVIEYAGRHLSVTASGGVATLPHALATRPGELLALASAALYDARTSGGNRVVSAL